jgi:hypothetical protein
MLWMDISGRTYVLGYNHADGTIEMKDRVQTGSVLHAFSNSTPIADIETIFRAL